MPKILIMAIPIWAWKTNVIVEGSMLKFNFVSLRWISRSGVLCGAINSCARLLIKNRTTDPETKTDTKRVVQALRATEENQKA